MNVKLLRRVAKHILAEPKRLVMDAYFMLKDEPGSGDFKDDAGKPLKFAKCGTAACIAGWSCFLSGDGVPYGQVATRAQKHLSISKEQGSKLFYVMFWPTGIGSKYLVAKSQRDRARIAANRIEHFIKTGE